MIRRVENDDILPLVALIKEAEIHDGSDRWLVDYILNAIDKKRVSALDDRYELYVRTNGDGILVSTCGFYRSYGDPPDTAWLDFFATKMEYRRMGHGIRIFDFIKRELRGMGVKRVCVWTGGNLTDGLKFYSKQGFKEFGRLKDFWGKGSDKVYLVGRIGRGGRSSDD